MWFPKPLSEGSQISARQRGTSVDAPQSLQNLEGFGKHEPEDRMWRCLNCLGGSGPWSILPEVLIPSRLSASAGQAGIYHSGLGRLQPGD